jgi:hypothetical protein
MNGQAEAMLFESPTEVRRDPDVERASVRTHENVNDRPTFHDSTYYILQRLLGSARSLRSGLRPSVETTERIVVSTEARSAERRDLASTIGYSGL